MLDHIFPFFANGKCNKNVSNKFLNVSIKETSRIPPRNEYENAAKHTKSNGEYSTRQ